MVIKSHDTGLLSAVRTDPDGQGFGSFSRQNRGSKRPLRQANDGLDENASLIELQQPRYSEDDHHVLTEVGRAVSFSQTQDAFLQKVHASLSRMSELGALALDTSRTETDRASFSAEFQKLQSYLNEVHEKTYEGKDLFGEQALSFSSESGTTALEANAARLSVPVAEGGLAEAWSSISIDTVAAALDALDKIQRALTNLVGMRAKVCAKLRQLTLTGERLTLESEMFDAHGVPIRNFNVAEESTRTVRFSLLDESGPAMMAQANALPQSALRLLD